MGYRGSDVAVKFSHQVESHAHHTQQHSVTLPRRARGVAGHLTTAYTRRTGPKRRVAGNRVRAGRRAHAPHISTTGNNISCNHNHRAGRLCWGVSCAPLALRAARGAVRPGAAAACKMSFVSLSRSRAAEWPRPAWKSGRGNVIRPGRGCAVASSPSGGRGLRGSAMNGFGSRGFVMQRGSEPRIRRALGPQSSFPAQWFVSWWWWWWWPSGQGHFARAAFVAAAHHFSITSTAAVRRARGQFSRTVNRRVALDERLSPYLRTLVGCAPHGAAVSRASSSSSSSSSRGTGGGGRVSGDMCCASGVSETRTISGSHHGSHARALISRLRSGTHSLTQRLSSLNLSSQPAAASVGVGSSDQSPQVVSSCDFSGIGLAYSASWQRQHEHDSTHATPATTWGRSTPAVGQRRGATGGSSQKSDIE
jgi:hypothetical protein